MNSLQEERRIHQEIELQTYLNRLVIEDKERKSEELRKTGEDVDVLVSYIVSEPAERKFDRIKKSSKSNTACYKNGPKGSKFAPQKCQMFFI